MEQPKETQAPDQPEDVFNEADFSMQGYDKHVRNARIMLFIIAGLQLVNIFLEGPLEDEIKWIVYGIHGFVAAIFVALAFWTKYKPYPALITALITYVGLVVLFALLDPSTIFKGIILKIAVVVLLILGIRNAKEGEDLKRTFGR